MILVHLKRGAITAQPARDSKGKFISNSIYFMMNHNYATKAESAKTYTDAVLREMDHPFLMYIDHYYVGATITEPVETLSNSLLPTYIKLYNSPNEVEVMHKALSYEDFLAEENIFDIANRVDPNTFSGSMHNLFNSMTFDKDYKWQVENYYKKNPTKTIPLALKAALNI